MDISEFTIKLLIFLIPGFIVHETSNNLISQQKQDWSAVIYKSLIFSCVCYFFYFLLTLLPFLKFEESLFFSGVQNPNSKVSFREIFITSTIAVPVSFLYSWLVNKDALNSLAAKLQVSDKVSGSSVWQTVLSQCVDDKRSYYWLRIIDRERKVIYDGRPKYYGEDDGLCEIFLKDVTTYSDANAKEIESLEGVYICRKKEDLILEILEFDS
jgi:hypothetical protein